MIDAEVVTALGEEIRILRQVLDEIREELSWANNNAQDLSEFHWGHVGLPSYHKHVG